MHLALGRFGAVFELRVELRLDPDGAMRDLFGVGLGFADQRLQPRLQLSRRGLVEAEIDLAGIDQVLAL
jgi:hypothetical protein